MKEGNLSILFKMLSTLNISLHQREFISELILGILLFILSNLPNAYRSE